VTRVILADQAYRELRAAMVEHRLVPGAPLQELELAAALGVSRTPIREALARLHLEGFVVREGETGALSVAQLTRAAVEDVFRLRITLEGHAARLAAERISLEELDRLDALVVADREALRRGDSERLGSINLDFHDTILRASRNRMMGDLLLRLRRQLAGFTAFAVGEMNDQSLFVAEHAEMARLLRDGEVESVGALAERHLEAARNVLLRDMQTTAEDRPPTDDEEWDDHQTRSRPAAHPRGSAGRRQRP
jgi:DNA-binding GntR family transcriptional regulator